MCTNIYIFILQKNARKGINDFVVLFHFVPFNGCKF